MPADPKQPKSANPAAASPSVPAAAPTIPDVAADPVVLTMPDGKTREIARGTTGLAVAKSISPSLAKRTVAMSLDGVVHDLADPIMSDAAIRFLSRSDAEALELIRHDCAHVLAEAVQQIWPGTQVTIGPVIQHGFFYDFAKAEPFEPDDLPKIEKAMHAIIAMSSGSVSAAQANVGNSNSPRCRLRARGLVMARTPRPPGPLWQMFSA
jgi:hypothetical protein